MKISDKLIIVCSGPVHLYVCVCVCVCVFCAVLLTSSSAPQCLKNSAAFVRSCLMEQIGKY